MHRYIESYVRKNFIQFNQFCIKINVCVLENLGRIYVIKSKKDH
jgi:hypothetical protein